MQHIRGLIRPGFLAALCVAAALGLAACGSSGSSASSAASTTTSTANESGGGGSEAAVTVDQKAAKAAGFPNYDSFKPPKFQAPAGARLAFLMPETVVPLQRSIIEGVEAAAARDGAEVKVFDAGGYVNVSKQVGQMETAIGEGFDAIMMLPASPAALNAQITAAKKAGIVVTADLIPPESEDLSFALYDSLPFEGETGATALAEAIGGEGEIYGLFGGEGSAPNIYYVEGALKALKKFPKVKMVFREDFPAFNAAEAQTATENAVAAHPDVKGVLTNSTSLVSGVQRALTTAGKSSVPTVGIGPNTKAELEELRSEEIVTATTAPFFKPGELITEWTLAILAGKQPKEQLLAMPPMVITPDNLEEAISSGALYQALTPTQLGCGPGQSEEC